ncbi:Nlrp12 [Symbiodinium natans]|uniref:Nlrp12 protein n=1 Tax=Symbiodinium natans TaxID=878477 RepID=A0A812UHC9_9DINO|nr:Nlrp12 [Symbiodinium natans]
MHTLKYEEEAVGLETVQKWIEDKHLRQRCEQIELVSKKVKPEVAQLLSVFVFQCRHLHTLILSNNALGDDGAVSLASYMEIRMQDGACPVKLLDLSGTHITAGSVGHVAKAFLGQWDARGDDGEENVIGQRSCRSATQGAYVPVLDLSHNVLEDCGVEAIAAHVVRSVCLRLRNVGCKKDGLQKLLKCHDWIVELDLGMNEIGVAGVTALFSTVKSSKRWELLNVSRLAAPATAGFECAANLVTPEMVECLRKAPGLKDLDCSENRLDDDRAKIIVEAVKDSETDRLQRLAMNESGCGILTAEALKAVLSQRAVLSGRVPYGSSRCTALRILELRGNKLHDDCMKIFSQGLGDSISLEKLILAGNEIGDVGVTHLAEGLKKQRDLNSQFTGKQLSCVVELDLSCNPVGDQGAKALADAAVAALTSGESVRFEALWGVEELILRNTGITAKGCDALSCAVAARATLAMEAALALRRSDELIEKVRVKRLRRPRAVQVHGLDLIDPPLRSDAETELQDLWPTLPTPLIEEQALGITELVVNMADGDSEGDRTPYAGLPDVDPMDAWLTDEMPGKRHLEDSTVHCVRMDADDSELISYSLDATDDWFNDGGQSPVRTHQAATTHAGKGVNIKNLLEQELASSGPTSVELNAGSSPEASPIASDSSLESSRRSSLTSEEASRQASEKVTESFGVTSDLCKALEVNFNNVSTVSNVSMASNASNASHASATSDVESNLTASPTERAAQEEEGGSPSSAMAEHCSMGSGKGDKGKLPAPGKGKGLKGPKGPKGKGKAPATGKQGTDTELESSNDQEGEKANEAKVEKEAEQGEQGDEKPKSGSESAKGKGPGKGPPGPPGKGAKGPGKGPGKGPPGKGKAPPPPKGDGKGKAAPKSKAAATPPRFVGQTPLGRRLHWAGAHYDEPSENSVFHGLTSDVRFDPELLKAMLSGESAEKPVLFGRRKSVTKKAGISLLDGSRAQNLAIVMSKMKVSTEEFCQNLKELHFSESFINPEDVELLIHVLPTAEESKKLLEYKDRVADLRDVG